LSDILQITYNVDGALHVQVQDPNSGSIVELHTADLINQIAVDAAFERRAHVNFAVDDNNQILEVKSEQTPPPLEGPPLGQLITRISTGVQVGGLVLEAFFAESPSGTEKSARTRDPVMQLLCHGAYLSQHPLQLTLDDEGIIKKVVKQRVP
jgi:hypothetical protein